MLEDTPDSSPKRRLREQINENLRRVYEDTMKEEVPDRFRQLLDQLRAKESKT